MAGKWTNCPLDTHFHRFTPESPHPKKVIRSRAEYSFKSDLKENLPPNRKFCVKMPAVTFPTAVSLQGECPKWMDLVDSNVSGGS